MDQPDRDQAAEQVTDPGKGGHLQAFGIHVHRRAEQLEPDEQEGDHAHPGADPYLCVRSFSPGRYILPGREGEGEGQRTRSPGDLSRLERRTTQGDDEARHDNTQDIDPPAHWRGPMVR